MAADESLFLRRVVERLATPDELEEALDLEPWRGWPLLLAVALLLAAALLWSRLGEVGGPASEAPPAGGPPAIALPAEALP